MKDYFASLKARDIKWMFLIATLTGGITGFLWGHGSPANIIVGLSSGFYAPIVYLLLRWTWEWFLEQFETF